MYFNPKRKEKKEKDVSRIHWATCYNRFKSSFSFWFKLEKSVSCTIEFSNLLTVTRMFLTVMAWDIDKNKWVFLSISVFFFFFSLLAIYPWRWNNGGGERDRERNVERESKYTPSVPLCLSFIPFWDVPKYCHVSKNKSH